MKKIFSILVVFALSVSLASCNATETSFDLETETEIIVGLEAAYAPFNWSTPTENEFTVEIFYTIIKHFLVFTRNISISIFIT